MDGSLNCTWSWILNTHTQPRINQINTKIDRRIVASIFAAIPKLANTVNVVDSGMKHINVLKRSIRKNSDRDSHLQSEKNGETN